MKKLVREYEFNEEQMGKVRALARELSLTETVVKLLVARGVDTAEKIRAFLSPSESHFLSPYLMSGMQAAADLIRRAQREGWNVAVFGDYDADGICATSVMYYALSALGIEPYVFVPERSDGYGLSVQAVDKIFEEFIPDLFITVDCGISNRREVEYVKEQGAYVIVTDHHELPEELPDCICINPKLRDDYPYDNLCGAGVAFKLACALLGKEAYGLLDFAALATVADSVPLLGENRDIVHEGLKRISKDPRPAFAALLGSHRQGEAVTAQTLAFTVAPRINAAGRMGDAASALRLFLSDSLQEIYDLAVKLNEYNIQRQRCCDELYESAKAKIRKKGAYGNVIMLSDEHWSSGFVGIVAARIAEEYCRPTLLFVQSGDSMKGSARSIESVNIFDALKNCSGCIEEFGGHAQAAGINIRTENFDTLERALDEYIGRTYAPEDFIPKLYVSEEITSEFSLQLAHELNALEPYGVGHKKPLFYLTARALPVRPVKNKSPHILIKTDYIDLMYFNGAVHTRLIESDVEKKFVFECNCSVFRGRESVKGFVKDILYDGNSGSISAWRFASALERLRKAGDLGGEVEYLSRGALDELIKAKRSESAYGLCLVASDPRNVQLYDSVKGMPPDLIYLSARNVANALVISPAADADFSDYRDVVFLDQPADFNLTGIQGKRCYATREANGFQPFLRLDATREGLLAVFAALRSHAGELRGGSAEETAVLAGGLGFSVEECMFALSVFEELGLIDYASGRIVVYRGVRADLNDSRLYRRVVALQREAK